MALRGIFDDILDVGKQVWNQEGERLINSTVQSVELTSNYTPDIVVDPSKSSDQSDFYDRLMKAIRPRILMRTSFGPIDFAPWGSPARPTQWPKVMWTGLLVGSTLAFFTAFGIYALFAWEPKNAPWRRK